MCDTKAKEIMIVDYKTGLQAEENQIEKYKSLINDLKWCKKEKYLVEGRYLEIRI